MKKRFLLPFYFSALFFACKENEISQKVEPAQYLDVPAEDILISEILPDPKKDGVEFIEIYNNSTRLIDLIDLQIASTNSSGKRSKLHPVSASSTFIYPHTYKLLSVNSKAVQSQYPFPDQSAFHEMSSFPTLTNSQGAVLIFRNEQLIDSVFYKVSMHDAFIKDPKGVSLERVSFHKKSITEGNFISAAASSGYATPGYKNSQLENQENSSQSIYLNSKTFVPNQGDQLAINLIFPHGGIMANLYIYNMSGKKVRTLLRNHRLGVENSIRWDGKDDKHKQLPTGIYLLLVELYDLKGNLSTWKESCIIAGNL